MTSTGQIHPLLAASAGPMDFHNLDRRVAAQSKHDVRRAGGERSSLRRNQPDELPVAEAAADRRPAARQGTAAPID